MNFAVSKARRKFKKTAMVADYAFKVEDMEIDEGLGFPRAYAKLCRDHGVVGTCTHGPPFSFTPYAMEQHEVI